MDSIQPQRNEFWRWCRGGFPAGGCSGLSCAQFQTRTPDMEPERSVNPQTGMSGLQAKSARCLISMVDQGWKASGKSSGRDANRFRCAAVLAESRWSRGSSRQSAGRYRVRRNNHSFRDAATVRGASWHFDDRSFRVRCKFRECFFPAIFQNTLNRGSQISKHVRAILALACRLRHFRAGGNEVFVPLLDDCRVLILHDHTLVWRSQAFNSRSNLRKWL
jgi:hypothetical protein